MRIPACSQVRSFGWLSVVAFALAVITSELAFFWTQPEMRDFGAFYESALSWRETGLLYTGARSNPNLNPPHVSILLFVPLLFWNFREAAQIWSAVQIAGFAVGLSLICREVRLSAWRSAWVVAVFLGSAPVHHQFREGQVGGMLFLFATIAWWRARQGRPFAAWLTISASLKPWLVCWIPLLSWRNALCTAGAGLLLVVVSLTPIGVQNWLDWLDALQRHSVRPVSVNASILAAVTRLSGQNHVSDVPEVAWVRPIWSLLGLTLVGVTWWRRGVELDRRWLVFGLAGILVSPIGWAYYFVAIAAPLVAFGEARAWPMSLLVPVVLLCAPFGIIADGGLLSRNILTVGAVLLWLAGIRLMTAPCSAKRSC
jgi:hypothetical protein